MSMEKNDKSPLGSTQTKLVYKREDKKSGKNCESVTALLAYPNRFEVARLEEQALMVNELFTYHPMSRYTNMKVGTFVSATMLPLSNGQFPASREPPSRFPPVV